MAKTVPPQIDVKHLEFATPRQRQIAETYLKTGNFSEVARQHGISRSSAQTLIKRLIRTAARSGYFPQGDASRPTIPGQYLKGLSTCYNRAGEITQQWVLQRADRDMMEEIAREIADSLLKSCKAVRPVSPPKSVETDLMVNYVIADLHLGMYAWEEETGEDYDCKIASECLQGAMQRLVGRAPSTETAIISQLGDFVHMNDTTNETPRGKNKLDVDTRWPRVVRIGVELYRTTIELALRKHQQVTVYNVCGNHDEHTAFLLGVAMQEVYRNNPRVQIVNSAGDYYYHRFGTTLLGLTHGHLAKPAQLGSIMMTDQKSVISECEYFYWLTGHIHHRTVDELGWYTHESFNTLAAKDAYAASRYRSGRSMTAIVYHKEHGEYDRSRVGITQIRESR